MHFQDSCAARECIQTVHQMVHFGLKDVFKSALENSTCSLKFSITYTLGYLAGQHLQKDGTAAAAVNLKKCLLSTCYCFPSGNIPFPKFPLI